MWRAEGETETGGGQEPALQPQAAELYLHCVLLVGDEVNAGLDSALGPFSQHLVMQPVNIWQERGRLSCWPHCGTGHHGCPRAWGHQEGPSPAAARGGTPGVPGQPRSPSNLPEKLSVALQCCFLFLFLVLGMSMG